MKLHGAAPSESRNQDTSPRPRRTMLTAQAAGRAGHSARWVPGFSGSFLVFFIRARQSWTSMTVPERFSYSFAQFELQPDERRLLRNGEQVQLTPKLLEMLELFVKSAGQVVSKEEILDARASTRFCRLDPTV
jgi:DNA-binding response OmpR family regulator